MSILKLTTVGVFLAAATLSAAAPPKAVAQGGVELVPWAGAFIPTRNSISDLDNSLSRDVSVIGGARLTFWGTGHLGFEAVGGYAPAKISGETINETNTNLLVAAGRLMLALSPTTNRVGFYIAGGPALLTRGHNTFDDDRSHTDFGANLGAGFRFGLGLHLGGKQPGEPSYTVCQRSGHRRNLGSAVHQGRGGWPGLVSCSGTTTS